MAMHSFVCDECEVVVNDTNTKGIHKCPICGKDMYWDLKRLAIHGNYSKPIHSDALAISPDQRAEHERLFPNIRLDGQNRPIFDNFTEHEKYLKKTGFKKHTKREKVKGKKI